MEITEPAEGGRGSAVQHILLHPGPAPRYLMGHEAGGSLPVTRPHEVWKKTAASGFSSHALWW